MPDFADPFSGNVPDRKMTLGELLRAIRLDLSAEEEAVNLYLAHADATDNALAAKVLRDVANEEREHAGEFQRLLKILDPEEETLLDNGAREVDEMAAGTEEEEEGGGEEKEEEASREVPSIGGMKE